MVLLKLVGPVQFALNSHTVTDIGLTDISRQISNLNMQVKLSLYTSWRCVGIRLQLHLFVTYILYRNMSSTAH